MFPGRIKGKYRFFSESDLEYSAAGSILHRHLFLTIEESLNKYGNGHT